MLLPGQALSAFTGQACRKYERMDTAAIAQYLANTLKAAESYDLLVLKSLLGEMAVGRLPTPAVLSRVSSRVLKATHPLTAVTLPERLGEGVGSASNPFWQETAQGYRAVCICINKSFSHGLKQFLALPLQGLVFVEDLSAEQVEALAGGTVLQAEVLAAGGPTPSQQASPKALARTTQRLVAALQHVRSWLPCVLNLKKENFL